MSNGKHCEIERKYLIRCPETAMLAALPGCETWEITQIYLLDGPGGMTRRIRKVFIDGKLKYFRTFKHRLTDMTCLEEEGEIAAEEYERLCREADASRQPVIKTRYRVPHAGHVLEFDIFPFWKDRALMEIELEAEDEDADIPEYVDIIRDVTGEKAYKNRQIAKRIPMEEI